MVEKNKKEKNTIISGPLPFAGFPGVKAGEVPKGWTRVEIKK